MRVAEMGHRDVNAVLGILGMVLLGVLSLWFPTAVVHVPRPEGRVASLALTAVWQSLVLGGVPYVWAMRRLRMRLGELGISTRCLGLSTLLGCGLYTIALVAFIHCSGGSMMQNHVVRQVGPGEAAAFCFFMSVIAGGTDILTRGFILLTLSRHGPVAFAITMQNIVWYLGHVQEIGLLNDCLGLAGATALTLTLGILGDMVVLRTRNVVGLSLAHVVLNVVLTVYLRMM